MYPSISILVATLLGCSLVSAHGKVAVITGDLGGNGTALGIMGAVVPGAGSNSKTELDTTTFNIGKNNCGETVAGGKNRATSGVKAAMALSGTTLPQISMVNASISGTFHIVTSDGAGPLSAIVDTTGKGNFTHGVKAIVTTQIPGVKGNIQKSSKRWGDFGIRGGIVKRASNINEDFPFAVAIPAGTICTGTVAGQKNVCMIKIVNPSNAGPFGGCVAVQQVAAAQTSTKTKLVQPFRV